MDELFVIQTFLLCLLATFTWHRILSQLAITFVIKLKYHPKVMLTEIFFVMTDYCWDGRIWVQDRWSENLPDSKTNQNSFPTHIPMKKKSVIRDLLKTSSEVSQITDIHRRNASRIYCFIEYHSNLLIKLTNRKNVFSSLLELKLISLSLNSSPTNAQESGVTAKIAGARISPG